MAAASRIVVIPEHHVEGKRLGRHVEHDPRSRAFGVARAPGPLRRVTHRRYGGPFDQGNVGSCTGNAGAGAANTLPLHRKGGRMLREADAVGLYERATVLDEFDGSYPPDDTGSSGLAVAKAMKEAGLISEYRHAFGIDDALAALQEGAVITGTNWTEGQDDPDADGFVHVSGQVRGGHEYEVVGFVPARTPFVVFVNSWGAGWGARGRARLTVADWAGLLDAQGDATILLP